MSNKNQKQRTCRICGCTESDCRQCIEKTGAPCYWIEEDLCSACKDAPREHPIIFSTPMVRAILDCRKTMTRRIIKPQPQFKLQHGAMDFLWYDQDFECIAHTGHGMKCPYGDIGDILWVRETFSPYMTEDGEIRCCYKADPDGQDILDILETPNWKPSIHMPRTAARIFLEVTNIRVERLRAITEDDARAEGVSGYIERNHPGFIGDEMPSIGDDFKSIWADINGDDSWLSNPWVWVIEFKKIHL